VLYCPIQHIIDHNELCGPVNMLAPQPVSNAEFANILSRVVHRPRFLRIPGPILRLALGEVADALLDGDANLRPKKLLASGFEFHWPDLESALRHELSI
jgi:NAD dependent epimerase/dehydratase family enzyme